jgi:hypothetical protein
MRTHVSLVVGLGSAFLFAWAAMACSGAAGSSLGGGDGGSSSTGGGSGSSGSSGASGSSGGSSGASGSGGSSGGASSSSGGSSGGGSSSGGSGSGSGGPDGCPPCDPGNVNLAGSDCDLDCSGTSAPPGPCDKTLVSSGPAEDFAKALGICQAATGSKWGLVSATYTQGYQSTAAPNAGQHGILPKFGSVITPREGARLGVLSSGWANECDDASAATTCSASGMGDPYFKGGQTAMTGTGTAPPGYPRATGSCAIASTVADVAGITLQIKVPKNAMGLSFDFDFYSSEWPEYVCSMFNDSFVAWLTSSAWGGHNGSDFNLAFDVSGNCISVNSPFLTRCTAGTPTGCSGSLTTGTATCTGGPSELGGTGYENLGTYCTTQSTGGGATGWLTTTAPVKGGETITMQFIIWDTGDPNWDSSVLIDHFTWYGTPKPAETQLAK